MNEHIRIFPPNFVVILVNEILVDDISPLYMDPSNRTYLDISNQRDNTSLHQNNDRTKLIFYCIYIKIQIEQYPHFFSQ